MGFPRFARPSAAFFMVLAWVLATDQATKAWVKSVLPLGGALDAPWPGFIEIIHTSNTGVAFGKFQGNNEFLIVIVLAILVFAFWYTRDLNWKALETNLIGGLIAGGAVGNLIDRFLDGHVTDFMLVWIGSYPWPAFNVADACISCSVVWLIFRMWFGNHPQAEAPRTD